MPGLGMERAYEMNARRSSESSTVSGGAAVDILLEQILGRLEALEQRIARLEAGAQPGRPAPTASNADAFGPGPDSGPPTERLPHVPAKGSDADPFPDLSLLDEKIEPKKGPPQRMAVASAIEAYPRIAMRIQQLWGTPDCEPYLNSLVIDTRGNRQGFPPEVMEELLYLGRLARALVILGIHGDLWETYDQIGDRR